MITIYFLIYCVLITFVFFFCIAINAIKNPLGVISLLTMLISPIFMFISVLNLEWMLFGVYYLLFNIGLLLFLYNNRLNEKNI